jgi:hypothetical protein
MIAGSWPVLLVSAAVAAIQSPAAPAPADLVSRWAAVAVVRYHAVGDYADTAVIAYREPAGQAIVADRVVLDFDWDVKAQKLVGEATVENRPSSVTGLRNTHLSCPAPVPSGAYEHLTVAAVLGTGGALELKGTRTFPAVAVVTGCQGVQEPKTVAAWEQEVVERLPVPSPLMLAAPAGADPNLTVSADRTSFTVKAGAWTWTFTPSPK